jgi:hypothetical protein
MNGRVQITLDVETYRRARAKAADLGISFAEFVRRALARDLDKPKPKPDMSVFFDLGASDVPTNVARDKDRLIGEAFWEEHLRSIERKSPSRAAKRARR